MNDFEVLKKALKPGIGDIFETSFKAKQIYMYSYIWARKVSTSVDFRAFSSICIKVYSFCLVSECHAIFRLLNITG